MQLLPWCAQLLQCTIFSILSRNTQLGKRPSFSHNTIPSCMEAQIGQTGRNQDASWFILHHTQISTDRRAQLSLIHQHTIKRKSGQTNTVTFYGHTKRVHFPIAVQENGIIKTPKKPPKLTSMPIMPAPPFLQGCVSWLECQSTLIITPTAKGTSTPAATKAIVSSWPGSASVSASSSAYSIWSWGRNKPNTLMGVWGRGGLGRRKQPNLGGKQESLCRNNREGRGVGRGKEEGERPKPKPYLGRWDSLLPSTHPWKKVVGWYADASLTSPESPPLATKYGPVHPQLHTLGASPAAIPLAPLLRVAAGSHTEVFHIHIIKFWWWFRS